jgi:hypothetical protein
MTTLDDCHTQLATQMSLVDDCNTRVSQLERQLQDARGIAAQQQQALHELRTAYSQMLDENVRLAVQQPPPLDVKDLQAERADLIAILGVVDIFSEEGKVASARLREVNDLLRGMEAPTPFKALDVRAFHLDREAFDRKALEAREARLQQLDRNQRAKAGAAYGGRASTLVVRTMFAR